jgi:hypothetical protein
VNNLSVVIGFSWVAEMAPMQAWALVVLEAAPKRSDP